MSIFWLGGKQEVFPPEKLGGIRGKIHYFKPGVIHGCDDHLIRVSLREKEDGSSVEEFDVEYIYRVDILEAANEDPSLCNRFWEILDERAEGFAADNDGSGDFYTLCEEWPKSVAMTAQELLAWAKGVQ